MTSQNGSRRGLPEDRLELGEGHLDGIEVRRIGRQIEQGCAGRLDSLFHAADLVGGQVIHDGDVAGPQFGDQHLSP